jgi:sialidase-1
MLGCWALALPGEASAERYNIVVGGKLTDDARITGTTKPEGDREDDGAFVFAGLHNFVCAGAGFTSPDARIVAKLSIDKFDWTAAGMVVNHHCLGFDMKPDNKLFGAGTAFGKEPKAFANASDHITPGEPFEMEVVIQDGTLTYSINGKQITSVDHFPAAWQEHPPETGKAHKLQLMASMRPWRATMKLYDFYVETDGEMVPLPKTQTIYRSMGSRGTHTHRIPALVVTKKGTLLAFAEARRDGGHDTCDIDTVVRRSEDDGRTWGPEIIVFDHLKNVAGNPCPVVDRSTGRIWMLQTWNSNKVPEGQTKPGFGEDSRRVFVTYSDDDGTTWNEPKEITESAKLKHWSWYATGPGAGIQLERGKHKGRLIIPCDHKSLPEGGPQTYHSHILYSDDHGETWRIGAMTGHGLNECEAVELEDGGVMLNSRNHGVNEFYRGVSISKDGGETFSSFRRDPALLEPRCQASIRRYRWAEGHKPGVILFANPAWQWRTFLMLRISRDDGKTWPEAKIVYPNAAAYCDIAVLPDGRIAVLFERDNYKAIDLAILPAMD